MHSFAAADATRCRGERQRGYNLVALIVVLVVINVAVAAALPLWSTVIQRQQEEELLFRGWQYAEAIRVFQARNGRMPVRLQELIEVQPRCIRQLWSDPLSESGVWQPILAGTPGPSVVPPGSQPGAVVGGGTAPRGTRLGTPGTPGTPGARAQDGEISPAPTAFGPGQVGRAGPGGEAFGPIEGVRPTATGTAIKSFLGRTEYSQWEFRAAQVVGPLLGADGVPRSPRIGASSMSRPLPLARGPAGGAPPGSGAPVDRPDSSDSDPAAAPETDG